MKKRTSNAFKKKIYLVGKYTDGCWFWLEEASWDCDWYWGFGYLETYTDNENPSYARDIDSHRHVDTLIFKHDNTGNFMHNLEDSEHVEETVFENEEESWKFSELMKTFYILSKAAEVFMRGGANYSDNPAKEVIKSKEIYDKINNEIFPRIFKEVYKLLTPKGEQQ